MKNNFCLRENCSYKVNIVVVVVGLVVVGFVVAGFAVVEVVDIVFVLVDEIVLTVGTETTRNIRKPFINKKKTKLMIFILELN